MQKAIIDYNGMNEVERIIVDFDCIETTGTFLIFQNLMDDRFVIINKEHVLKIELDNININKYKYKYSLDYLAINGGNEYGNK